MACTGGKVEIVTIGLPPEERVVNVVVLYLGAWGGAPLTTWLAAQRGLVNVKETGDDFSVASS